MRGGLVLPHLALCEIPSQFGQPILCLIAPPSEGWPQARISRPTDADS